MRWHNEYNVGTLQRPGLQPFTSPEDAVEKTAGGENAASTIGTPDDLVKTIKNLMDVSGGVGTIVGFVHDWANPENTRRSWDMVARYVIPEINGYIAKLRKSQKFLIENRAVFERAGQAVMAKIMENDKAAAALAAHRPGPRRDPDHQRAGPAEGSGEAQGVKKRRGATAFERRGSFSAARVLCDARNKGLMLRGPGLRPGACPRAAIQAATKPPDKVDNIC